MGCEGKMKHREKDNIAEAAGVADEPDKRELLEHAVYEVSDKSGWKVPEKEPGSWHPGVCWHVDVDRGKAVLYKGTSQQPKRSQYLPGYAILEPSMQNGLGSRTYLSLTEPFLFRLRQIELMHHDRSLGKLTKDDAAKIERVLDELKGTSHARQ